MDANAILMYHGVSPERSRRFKRFVVPPSSFEAQMAYLAHAGIRVCSVSDLVQARGAPEHDPGAVALTFDDAFEEIQTYALPVLARYGFRATIYVPSSYIGATSRWLAGIDEGDRRVLGADELRSLASTGFEIGAHSHTHPELDVLPIGDARHEIAVSKQALEEIIQGPVRTFAYPFGYESAEVRTAVRLAGFESACRVNYALSTVDEDVFGLSRLPIYGDTTISAFASLVKGERSLISQRARAKMWRPIRRRVRRFRAGVSH